MAGFTMMGCQNLAVPAEVMQYVVHVESGANPYAIGVVGGQLVRQPQNLDEALATVQMLEESGHNFSVGLGQINRSNLGKYGLTSYQEAFEPCANLLAASQILADCYTSANRDWGKAFSCYYSGNFVTGYRDGYVQKIYASMDRSLQANDAPSATAAIPLAAAATAMPTSNLAAVNVTPDADAYRVAIRSTSLLDAGAASTTTATTAAPESSSAPTPTSSTTPAPTTAAADIFVPRVRGPNDPVVAPSPALQAVAASATAPPSTDHADLRQGRTDAAFVF